MKDVIDFIFTMPVIGMMYVSKYVLIPFGIVMLLISPIMPFIEIMNWALDPRINRK